MSRGAPIPCNAENDYTNEQAIVAVTLLRRKLGRRWRRSATDLG